MFINLLGEVFGVTIFFSIQAHTTLCPMPNLQTTILGILQ